MRELLEHMTLYDINGLSCDMSASSNLLLPCPTVNTTAAGCSLPKKPHNVTYFTAITAVHPNMQVMALCLSAVQHGSVLSQC